MEFWTRVTLILQHSVWMGSGVLRLAGIFLNPLWQWQKSANKLLSFGACELQSGVGEVHAGYFGGASEAAAERER